MCTSCRYFVPGIDKVGKVKWWVRCSLLEGLRRNKSVCVCVCAWAGGWRTVWFV